MLLIEVKELEYMHDYPEYQNLNRYLGLLLEWRFFVLTLGSNPEV